MKKIKNESICLYQDELFKIINYYPCHLKIFVKSNVDIALQTTGFFISDIMNCLKEVLKTQTPCGKESHLLLPIHLFPAINEDAIFNEPKVFSAKLRQAFINKFEDLN